MVTTPAPGFNVETILDIPFAVLDGIAMIGLPSFTQCSATHKIHLSANTGKLISANGISTYLAGNINFNRTVDGNHFVISADDMRIIYIINIQKLESRIIIYIIIQPSCAQCKCRNGFSWDALFYIYY